MFIRQANVYAAYLAYTDAEIGRVIDAVEANGDLDNTLIIYISGDNGSSAEGTLDGTPNEVAMFNGVNVPVDVQLKYFYDIWGSEFTYNHMAVAWSWAFDTPFKWTKQISSLLRRHAAGHGHRLAQGHHRQGRHPQPVRPRDRHRADHPGGRRTSAQPSVVDGIAQSPIEGVEPCLHLRCGEHRTNPRTTAPSISRCSATMPSITKAGRWWTRCSGRPG